MGVYLVRRVVCASLISLSIVVTQPAVSSAASYDSEAAAEAACLDFFRASNAPGSENRQLLERSPTFSSELLDKWVEESIARQNSDGKFCYGYNSSLLGDGGSGWSWLRSNPCQTTYSPIAPNPPKRDLSKFPIHRTAPRLTALHMIKGGSANGDIPMFGGIFTPHVVYAVSFDIARDSRFNEIIYSVKNSPQAFSAACWYPDRIDMANSGKSKVYLDSIWAAAANWQIVSGIPGWIKGDHWLRVTVSAPGLGSDSIVGSVFLPDGHGGSRYEQPRQSASVIDIDVTGDSLTTTVIGSMDPYRELTICVWTESGKSQRNQKCTTLKQESKAPQVGAPTTYNFNWRNLTRSDLDQKLVKLTVAVSNDYGSDLMEFTDEQLEEPETASTQRITCRRGTTKRRFKQTVCPSGWRPA